MSPALLASLSHTGIVAIRSSANDVLCRQSAVCPSVYTLYCVTGTYSKVMQYSIFSLQYAYGTNNPQHPVKCNMMWKSCDFAAATKDLHLVP